MSTENVQFKVQEFVGQYLNDTELDPELDLFASGRVNSLFAMQLVLFIENEFGFQVQNDDLDYDNFKSLVSIEDFVQRKLGTAAN
jgi:methoxymalonate biosynthesis acyl carrier protein